MFSPTQLRRAFIEEQESVEFLRLVEADGSRLVLEARDGTLQEWTAQYPERLVEILGRDDLTKRDGRPFVIASAAHRLLGIATGPAEVPSQIGFVAVLGMEHHTVPPCGPGQPEWWLVRAARQDGH